MIIPGKDGQTQQTIDVSQTTPLKCENVKIKHLNKHF